MSDPIKTGNNGANTGGFDIQRLKSYAPQAISSLISPQQTPNMNATTSFQQKKSSGKGVLGLVGKLL